MKLLIALIGALFAPALALSSFVSPTRDAFACSVGPPMFEQIMAETNVAVLVDVTEVDGPLNAQPTVTPRATSTPTATAAPASPTPTIDPVFPRVQSPTPTATAMPFDLTGYGATASVIKTYRGSAASTITVDTEGRAQLERALRADEARRPGDPFPPCPAWLGHFPYTVGQRYVLFGQGSADQIETGIYHQWEVHVDASGTPYVPARNMYVTRVVYETYLRGIDAVADERWYYITADRIPLATFERMITGEPAPDIVPPVTGSAGLKR
ncbi:MAG: hypothetical protein WEB52_14810 [Dehalococcoidia bacterium]